MGGEAKRSILLVVNPVSGNKDKTDMVARVRESLDDPSLLQVYETTGKDDVAALEGLMEKHHPSRVLVLGGDGTIKTLLEALGQQDPVLGILPGGSANGLATDLGLPMQFEEALAIALGDRTRRLDLLRLNETLGLHISDLGINAELILNYQESTAHGYLAYLKQTIPTLVQTESPYTFRIELDGHQFSTTARMIAFANSRKFGTGANINPYGKMDDGKFEVVVFKELKLGAILQTLMGKLPMDPDFVEIFPTTRARVSCETPVSFQIDGEHQGKVTAVEAEIVPGKVAVAAGPNDQE